ncbi:MAG: nucleoside hydrolase [Acidobacteria bacterium]|nr:nucleoside hydrolase [Acidobacteriota bacterium]
MGKRTRLWPVLPALLAVSLPAAGQPEAGAAGEREKVLFDCDIGSDIDDAYAMALLLASPEIELVGVTVGHARTADRAFLALRMLWETGLDHIPVHVGRETPLVTLRDGAPHEQFSEAPYNRQFHWGRGFDEVQPRAQPAAEFIVETLAAHPGEITLLTVGPVTNIGDALEIDPNVLKNAKRVVSMYGSIRSGYDGGDAQREWNVLADAASSKRFDAAVQAGGTNVVYIPLDVTDHVRLDADRRLHLHMRGTPLTSAVTSLYSLWRNEERNQTTPRLFDAVAVGYILWPDLFGVEHGRVTVDERSMTLFEPGAEPTSTVALEIDDAGFIERMVLRFLEQNLHR